MRSRGGQGRAWSALALSLALHAVFFLALFRLVVLPPAGAPPDVAIEVALVPRLAPPEPVSPVAPGITTRAPRAVDRPGAGSAVEERGPEAGAEAGEGAASGEVARWLGEDPARRAGPVFAPASPLRPPPVRTRAEKLDTRMGEVVDALRADDLARYPDASWTDLRDALREGFAFPAEALDSAVASGAGGAGSGFLGRLVEGLAPAAERFARTGSPIAPGPAAPGAVDGSVPASKRTVAAAGAVMHPERAALATAVQALDAQPGPAAPTEQSGGLVAVVAVTIDAAGTVSRVRLVSRSASAAYDRAALEQAERLAGRELARRLAGNEVEWAFVTEVRIRPMSPAGAVMFDATFKPSGWALPLQRLVFTRVELRAVRRSG